MYTEMMTNFKQTNTNILDIQSTQRNILDRLDKMEKEKEEMSKNHASLSKSVSEVRKDVAQVVDGLQEVHERLAEEISRVRKMTNIVLFGLPEDDAGRILAQELMQILLPSSHQHITSYDERLGAVNPTLNRPRPLRIRLSSATEKSAALSNCRKLKGLNQFKGISVKQDMTKFQQQSSKARRTPVRTRSTSRRKRSLDDETDDGPLSKKQNSTVAMETSTDQTI